MQDIREINNLIKQKIKTPELSDIYAAVAHNNHLPFATAVKLGAAFGAVTECNTYDGWNNQGVRVRRGQHALYAVQEKAPEGCVYNKYFSAQQTTAANRNKRTLQSLFDHINDYTFMKISADKIDFAALCAAVRNYADENGVKFNADFEENIVTGIASILAYRCNDSATIEITPQPLPEQDYLENAALLKEIGGYAAELEELIQIAESKEEARRTKKSNVAAVISSQEEDSKQIDLFETQTEPTAQQAPPPEPVAERSTVQLLPMYQSYLSKKAAYPGALVFQRVGDFYEVLGDEDTKKLSDIFELTINGRMVGLPERMPMVGIPYHAIDNYVSRLLEEGTYKKIIIANDIPEEPDRVIERTPDFTVNIEEAKVEAAARHVTFEEGREKARAEAERTGEPYVTIEWSENPAFNTGDVLSFYEADNLFAKLDKEFSDLGYDKVKFHIDFNYKGSIEDYEGRYDIGDRDNGLINHIDSFGRYASTEEARRDFAELCQYLRQHKKLSDIFETFEGNSEEIRAVYDYVKTNRAALNSTERVSEFVLSELPEVLKNNKQLKSLLTPKTVDEPAPVEEVSANTDVAAPIAQEPPADIDDDIFAEEQRLTFGGAKTRFKDNLEALKVYRRLSDTGATATPEEKAILKKYVGWGGLSEVFDTRNSNWTEERKQLTQYLSPYEYDMAQSTVTDAFYTPFTVVKGIYAALERFGVKGNNRILEPSMGIGNFFRAMPSAIKENSELHGVEIDTVTGEMAKLIYPEAKITVKGFEKTLLPANSFDVVIGNVPFGNSKPVDIEKDYDFDLHNFVIAKSVDKTRAGGIIALITTSATMNEYFPSARKYIADRAKFLGAIRLPYDTFKANANTSVTTDIIFLQKREEIIESNDAWIHSEWQTVNDNLDQGYLNDYFVEHPEMVLGEYKRISGRFGPQLVPQLNEGETLSEKLSEAITYLPENIFTPIKREVDAPKIEVLPADESVKNYCFTIIDGKLYQRQGDIMMPIPVKEKPKNAIDRISDMIDLRKEVRKILKIQRDDCSDEELKAAQGVLTDKYDTFVKNYGNLHSSVNKGLFQNDADCDLLLSLEFENLETKEISKADIFTKRSITPTTKPQHTDSSLDALQVCKSERGGVDIKFIEELTGKDYDTVLNELKGFIFKNPANASAYDKYRGFEPSEKYLSGDVKTKLQEAVRAAAGNEEFADNVRALEEVQPAPIPAEDIIVSLGASWIDLDIYEKFICEDILKIKNNKYGYGEHISVLYNDLINGYIVDADLYTPTAISEVNTNTYGTRDVSAVELFEQALNLKSPNVYDADTDAEGKPIRVFNAKKTALAREKQTKLKTEFAQWIFSDPKRREYLTNKYNEMFNRHRLPKYDGSSMTFPGMNPEITLNAHQKNAIYRGMADGTVLLHHCVGAGKTYEMDALIMKLRQSGLAHKPLQVVPKATLQQAELEFRTLYPNANLLVASNEDFKKDRLKAFTAKIALGDWDCIIMSSSQFDRINVSPERRAKKLGEEIEKITATLARAERTRGRKDNGLSVKRLQGILKNKRSELDRLMTMNPADEGMRFEDLGIDYLFIDEAHLYKNKYFFTKMSNVAGINSASSKRASALDLKIDYINELHGGDKGVIFATGTPISNSMSEMYTMQSYLQKSRLQKMGLDTFDDWASTFGEIVKSYEIKPAGNGYRTRERFASFVNVPELMTMYGLFADIKMLDELKLPVPTVTYEKIIAPKTAQVAELMMDISARAERINGGGVDPSFDNMLKITSDGKKIALDPRLFDNTLSEQEGGKLQLCAEKVAEIYHATIDNKSTQMIFCDSSTPNNMSFDNYDSKKNFNVYFEMKKKLIDLGVAADEIAFIHDYEDNAKIKLREEMNAGKIRVLLGSTSKCGTGLNVQQKLIAGHHLDIPYRPSDMEQREGRIIRQGNENKHVTIYTYAQEGTFDVYLFQILETKQRFIKQLLEFKIGNRKIEDIADNSVLSYAEMKAAISGNPQIIELEQLKQKEDNLNLLHAEYQRNLFRLQNKINSDYPREINRTTANIANIEKDIAMIGENTTDEFRITIGGRTFEGRTEEAGEAFMAAYKGAGPDVSFAKFYGFELFKDTTLGLSETKILLKGAGKYYVSIGDSGVGALQRLSNSIADFPDKLAKNQRELQQAENDMEEAKKEVIKPFSRADELTATLARIEELRAALEISDVATDDIVIDSSVKSDDTTSDENNYRRLPLEFMGKDDIYREIAQRFNADEITAALKQREHNPELIGITTAGINYSDIGSYSYNDLTAALENLHKFVTKRGFVIEDLRPAKDGTTNAIVHRVIKDAAGNITLDDYLIAINYDTKTGEWAQGRYDYSSLKSVTDSYNSEYAAVPTTDSLPNLKSDDIVKVEAIEHWVLTGTNSYRKINDGFSILHNEKTDEWYLFKDGLEIVHERGANAKEISVGAKISVGDILNHYNAEYKSEFIEKFPDKNAAVEYWNTHSKEFEEIRKANAALNESSASRQNLLNGQMRIASSLTTPISEPDYRKEVENIIDLEYNLVRGVNPKQHLEGQIYSYFKTQQYNSLEYLDEKQYEALYRHVQSGGSILWSLVNEAEQQFSGSLSSMEDITELVEQFNTTYYQDVLIKRNDVMQPLDIKATVQKWVEEEFVKYKNELIKKSPEDIFYNSFETYVKTEIHDTINGEVTLSDEVYRALYAEGEGILNELYFDFIGSDYASVNSYDDTAEFIESYCRHYQSAIMNGEQPLTEAEEIEQENARLNAEAEARADGIDLNANPEPPYLRFTKYGSPINKVIQTQNDNYAAIINNYAQGEQADGYEFSEGYPAGYLIAHDYNVETGKFVEGAYSFETYEEARKYYKDNYDVDFGESELPELSEEYRRKATEIELSPEQLMQSALYGVVYNWKGLKEENTVYTAAQLSAADPDFNPELPLQGGAFQANKTYDIIKLNGDTPEKTAENVRQFLTGSHNDSFSDDDAEMPEGWYWETKTENLFTGRPNPTTETLIKYLNLSEEDLRMAEPLMPEQQDIIYYGKDNDDTAYYFLPDKLSLDTFSGIKAEAFQFVVAAPETDINEDKLNDLGILFLKIGRDISQEDLLDDSTVITKMQDAASIVVGAQAREEYIKAQPVYLGTWQHAEKNDELDIYRYSHNLSEECKHAIDDAIRNNFDGMYLKKGFEDELIQKYGIERAGYILATTIRERETDGRFSRTNKDWARTIPVSESEDERRNCCLNIHPAVLDGFVNTIRQKMNEKNKTENNIGSVNHFKELTSEGKAVFEKYQQGYKKEPTNSLWDEVEACRTIANGIYEVSTAGHGGVMIAAELAPHILSLEALEKGVIDGSYYCYEEDCDACIPLRELYDKGILKPNDYFTNYTIPSALSDAKEGRISFNKATAAEKAEFIKRWNRSIDESLAQWNEKYWQAHEQAEPAQKGYNINSLLTNIKGVTRGTEDFKKYFPHLTEGKDIYVERSQGGWYIETTLDRDLLPTAIKREIAIKLAYEAGSLLTFANRLELAKYQLSSLETEMAARGQGKKTESDLMVYSEEDINAVIKDYEVYSSKEAAEYHKEWVALIKEGQSIKSNKHSMGAPRSTTLGEDLYNATAWNKVVLPNVAISLKGDKNVKIVMPESSEHSGAEFWVSKKFIKNSIDKNFKLILPDKYTVKLKTPQGDELSLNAKEVVDELTEHASSYGKKLGVETQNEGEIIDLDSTPKSKEVELTPEQISELNLSELRQDLVKSLVSAMESNDIEWVRSWATTLPKNGSTGREYAGINNLLLNLEKYKRGYSDNRWCTFKQIQDHKWKLKKGSKAAQIEVVKFIDKTTKKEFDEKSVDGMTEEERKEYWSKNVYPIMRGYSVFNADCIEGIPEEKLNVLNEQERNERCEKILANSPAKVFYDGGNDAYYTPPTDSIHLPKREHFYSLDDFYYTGFHEEGHSTGHPTRLNRNLSGMKGSENYAREELCAEIGSLFIGQSLGLKVSDIQLKSSAAYLKGWASKIRKDPKYLFTAITEANKIAKYVLALQYGTAAANKVAAQYRHIETLQRGGDKKQVGSAFTGKIKGQLDTASGTSKDSTNIME